MGTLAWTILPQSLLVGIVASAAFAVILWRDGYSAEGSVTAALSVAWLVIYLKLMG